MENDESTDEADIGELLGKLQPACPLDTPLRVPRRARRRLGKLIRKLLEDTINKCEMQTSEGQREAQTSVQLSKHAYALLTWRERNCIDEGTRSDREAKQWSQIRRRLQLAENGEWKRLVAEMLKGEEK